MNGRRAFQNILECHVTRMKNESKTSYKATTISQKNMINFNDFEYAESLPIKSEQRR